MKLKLNLGASLVGLALFMLPPVILAKPGFAQADAAAVLPQDILQILEDKRAVQQLSPDELKVRLHALRQAMADPSLPQIFWPK